mmetsp:Transcript_8076/g.30002  ORF Transcript_8076/g.30002 Transcript_8076/m.30002 type:complete len:120 (+) Transcript_8076:368-727(+)
MAKLPDLPGISVGSSFDIRIHIVCVDMLWMLCQMRVSTKRRNMHLEHCKKSIRRKTDNTQLVEDDHFNVFPMSLFISEASVGTQNALLPVENHLRSSEAERSDANYTEWMRDFTPEYSK